ncbi:hypothetical protein EGR_05717 [Echinococcus granulosus]|uniref:Uncharacterized protein n=1 Tax=Echinococcus granulosus TaxID=6210 RepID=W6UF25_ECHGR|nr:hypothetical protein EGR_05717 [Echinococcus granulosus]EUB59466.1 hypothetical protein EGR_05717 [Echinococcus granulosus]
MHLNSTRHQFPDHLFLLSTLEGNHTVGEVRLSNQSIYEVEKMTLYSWTRFHCNANQPACDGMNSFSTSPFWQVTEIHLLVRSPSLQSRTADILPVCTYRLKTYWNYSVNINEIKNGGGRLGQTSHSPSLFPLKAENKDSPPSSLRRMCITEVIEVHTDLFMRVSNQGRLISQTVVYLCGVNPPIPTPNRLSHLAI